MALLSGMMRASAMTNDPEYVNGWFRGRQFGRWMMQPPPRRTADPEATLRDLADLHARGIVSDAEFERLRARIGA
jgi:hypothetical protein